MSHAAELIAQLTNERRLGAGERAQLRALSGRRLDEDTHGFDLFTGLWWPLRQKNQYAPRREIAWLITKLYTAYPIPHLRPHGVTGPSLPQVLGRCEPQEPHSQAAFRRRFDALLCTSLTSLEPHLHWALGTVRKALVSSRSKGIDWVQLTDNLSVWDRGEEHRRGRDVRDIWAEQYLESTK